MKLYVKGSWFFHGLEPLGLDPLPAKTTPPRGVCETAMTSAHSGYRWSSMININPSWNKLLNDSRPARIERGQAVWRQLGGNGILCLGWNHVKSPISPLKWLFTAIWEVYSTSFYIKKHIWEVYAVFAVYTTFFLHIDPPNTPIDEFSVIIVKYVKWNMNEYDGIRHGKWWWNMLEPFHFYPFLVIAEVQQRPGGLLVCGNLAGSKWCN